MAVEDSLQVTFKTVIPDDPQVKSVKIVGPSEASVGEPVSFQATVYDQYDEPMPTRGVEWIVLPDGVAEVVEFSPSSMVLKGRQAGSVTITSRVKEVAPEDPTWPPEGYTELLPQVDFADGWWPASWNIREDAWGKATFTLVDGNPITGGKLARHSYLVGNGDGGPSGFMISPRFTPVQELIVEEVMRTSEKFRSHQSGVNKNGYTINDVGQQQGQSIHPHIWMLDGSRLRPGFGPQGGEPVTDRLTSSFECERGQWYRIRWRVIFSDDPTIGRYTIWAAKLGEELAMIGDWVQQSALADWDKLFDRIQIRPIWGGRGDLITEEDQPMFKEWALVRVAGR